MKLTRKVLTFAVLSCLGTLAADAFSVASPGLTLHAVVPADVPCFNRNPGTLGGVINTCAGGMRELFGSIDVAPGAHPTQVFACGAVCQSALLLPGGAPAILNPLTPAACGGFTGLGAIAVPPNQALAIRCLVAAGGSVGEIVAL